MDAREEDAATLDHQLARALEPVYGRCAIDGLVQLSGGASRETWSFDAVTDDGARHELVLRRDPPGRPSAPGLMGLEARVVRAAGAAGLAVPPVVADCDGPELWGSAGMVMGRVPGETLARRILRDEPFAPARAAFTQDCARFLAGLHSLDPGGIVGLGTEDVVAVFRQRLADMDEPSPTFELALRWLDSHRPEPAAAGAPAVVHGDFRLGNVIVGPDGLRAVLDWELVHQGDPIEDLGWLCVKAWRFGAPSPVAGMGSREELIAAYEAAGGRPVDPAHLRWWEVLGTLRWGLGCMGQARVHLNGMVRSVELAAIGRRTAEQEWDLLLLLDPDACAAALAEAPPTEPTVDEPGLLGRPTARELLAAVREFLTDDVMPGTVGRLSFHARVAANVVDIVERELADGGRSVRRRTDELASLGASSEDELAAAVRAGALDARDPELRLVLARGVAAKLAVANPRYLLAPPA